MAAVLAAAIAHGEPADAAEDMLPSAINFVFTGRVDPQDVPEIVDRKNCVVLIRDQRNKRYVRYYLARFKLDAARFNKRYSGSRTLYDLNVQGDDTIVEYLAADKSTVLQSYRSAQIPLPGDFDATRRALLIVSNSCKAKDPEAPF